MREVNLLSSLPKPKRNIQKRMEAKDPEVIAIARQFGEMYWDGPREYGYGGYKYDGRWKAVARDIIDYFHLPDQARILDIGCGKGFLLNDLVDEGAALGKEFEVRGIDVSHYALQHGLPQVKDKLQIASAETLPFADKSFDLVLSINTLHNLPRDRLARALREIERVSRGKSYIVVDSYHTPEQKEIFESWVLTAQFYGYPDEWRALFEEAGYSGHYSWTVIE
ncbi:MAG: class I SAM-dependent methyltransferase [Bdellovibrionales bacterium]